MFLLSVSADGILCIVRRQRRREQASALVVTTAKGWKQVLHVIDMLSDPSRPPLLPSSFSAVGPDNTLTGSVAPLVLRWKLDMMENPMRQRRKLCPFPDFVQHPPRHVWDAAKKSRDDSAQGKTADDKSREGSEGSDLQPGDSSLMPQSLVNIGKELIKVASEVPHVAQLEGADHKLHEPPPQDSMPQEGERDDTDDEDDEDKAGEEKEALDDDDDWVTVEVNADVLYSTVAELVTPAAVCAVHVYIYIFIYMCVFANMFM